MFGHGPPIILFESVARELWKFHPEILANQIFATPVEQFFRLPIYKRKSPVSIYRKKSVAGFFQDIGHFSDHFLQFRPRLVALNQRPNASFRYRKPDIQKRRIDRFSQVIVRAGFEGLFQVLRIITRRDQKNEKFIAVRPRAQFPAQVHSAFARQHPIQNQKRERLLRQLNFRFLGAADRDNFVSTFFDQPPQSRATFRMIFNEQYSHFWKYEMFPQNSLDQVMREQASAPN